MVAVSTKLSTSSSAGVGGDQTEPSTGRRIGKYHSQCLRKKTLKALKMSPILWICSGRAHSLSFPRPTLSGKQHLLTEVVIVCSVLRSWNACNGPCWPSSTEDLCEMGRTHKSEAMGHHQPKLLPCFRTSPAVTNPVFPCRYRDGD